MDQAEPTGLERIKQRLKETGIPQREIAKQWDVDPSQVTKFFKSTKPYLPADRLPALAGATGWSIEKILYLLGTLPLTDAYRFDPKRHRYISLPLPNNPAVGYTEKEILDYGRRAFPSDAFTSAVPEAAKTPVSSPYPLILYPVPTEVSAAAPAAAPATAPTTPELSMSPEDPAARADVPPPFERTGELSFALHQGGTSVKVTIELKPAHHASDLFTGEVWRAAQDFLGVIERKVNRTRES
jgi:hypothetical protein